MTQRAPSKPYLAFAPLALAMAFAIFSPGRARALSFVDVTVAAAVAYDHDIVGDGINDLASMSRQIAAGAAAGDYDQDGDLDLYVVRGDAGPNLLLRNEGNGSFAEVGAAAGVAGDPALGAGPVFADIDGDGWLDLLVGGIEGSAPAVYHNDQDGTFTNSSAAAGLNHGQPQYSMALADIDGDGDLDLAAVHWAYDQRITMWKNDGQGHFTDVSLAAGLGGVQTMGFTPIFADITDDGWPDLLVAGDFSSSRVLINDGDGTFTLRSDPAITDENGMGASVVDYDGDGRLDWFVSSIWDPNQVAEGNWGVTGNRLYRNTGGGVFADVTTTTGVREGYWGWGSCFADFDNDGHVDLFHVNGWPSEAAVEFHADPARLFMGKADATFDEQSGALGPSFTGQGRGVVCFDYDGDGDIDLFLTNNREGTLLFENQGGSTADYLTVALSGRAPNTEAIGARVTVTVGGVSQMREIRIGNNFESADPARAHFGLGTAPTADEVRVDWTDGTSTVLTGVPARQTLTIVQPPAPPPAVPAQTSIGLFFAALAFLSGFVFLRYREASRARIALRP